MSAKLDQFASQCHHYLKTEPGPAGREKVVSALEGMLKDADFVAEYLGEGTGGRDVLYEDPSWASASWRTPMRAPASPPRTITVPPGRSTARPAVRRR